MTLILPGLQVYACCSSRTAITKIQKEYIHSPGVPDQVKDNTAGKWIVLVWSLCKQEYTFALSYTFQATEIIRSSNTTELNR